MLSIKDINEVSFRKSNFSGYNSDDVDQFIDEVLETVTALTKENAEIKTRKTDDSAAVQQLQAKNAELQEKLSILAAKIESYRAEEDGIKAPFSAHSALAMLPSVRQRRRPRRL